LQFPLDASRVRPDPVHVAHPVVHGTHAVPVEYWPVPHSVMSWVLVVVPVPVQDTVTVVVDAATRDTGNV
jgi:hypothetical protein